MADLVDLAAKRNRFVQLQAHLAELQQQLGDEHAEWLLNQDELAALRSQLTAATARAEAAEKALEDVETLNAWRREERLVRQWVVGSQFATTYCAIQRHGEHIAGPFHAADETSAISKAANWVREQRAGKGET